MSKFLAVLGVAVVGAGALYYLGKPTGSTPGGAFGGGTKKEGATERVTETIFQEPTAQQPIYNITFPDPGFPSIPQIDFIKIIETLEGNGGTGNGDITTTTKKESDTYYKGAGGLIYSVDTGENVSGQFGLGKPRGWSMGVNLEAPESKKVARPSPLPEATPFQQIFEPKQIQLLRKIGG